MRSKAFASLTLAAAISSCLAATCSAEEADSTVDAPTRNAATVSVSRVLQESRPLQDQLEQLNREAKFTAARSSGDLRCATQPTPESRVPSKVLIHHAATGMSKKEFIRREAELYRLAYAQMQEVIAELCSEHGISIVFRVEPIEGLPDFAKRIRTFNDSKSCGTGVRREVDTGMIFWARDGIDITDDVIGRMDKIADLELPKLPLGSDENIDPQQ